MKKFTKLHRVIHWAIATAMLVLFTTGFLRMFWMSRKTITAAVSNELTAQNIQLSDGSLRQIAKSIIEPMFQWHIIFAYILIAAYLLRLIYLFAKGIRFPNPFSKNTHGIDRLQGTVYLIFYVLLIVQIMTGLALKFELAGESVLERAEEVHKFAVYWLPSFVLLHFMGIILGELTDKKGIVSKMIGGEQTILKK